MFGKSARTKQRRLERLYADRMRRARDAQRGGNIQQYAALVAEAEELRRQSEALA
jgi:hypothetical protein